MPSDTTDGSADDRTVVTSEDTPPRAVIIAALAIAVITVGIVLGVAVTRHPSAAPVVIAAVPAPAADTPECRALLASVPGSLSDLPRADTAVPTPAGTAAWRDGAEPVILRCGLDRPSEFVVGAPIQMVDDVGWFRLDDRDTQRSTWVTVDRPVYIALTLPAGSGSGPIQAISAVIARTMAAIPIRPGPPA